MSFLYFFAFLGFSLLYELITSCLVVRRQIGASVGVIAGLRGASPTDSRRAVTVDAQGIALVQQIVIQLFSILSVYLYLLKAHLVLPFSLLVLAYESEVDLPSLLDVCSVLYGILYVLCLLLGVREKSYLFLIILKWLLFGSLFLVLQGLHDESR